MRLAFLALILAAMLAGPALAGEAEAGAADKPGEAAAQKCQVAEINPVTGHVFCIKPLGAPVEAPKANESEPCKPQTRENADWTWRPKCKG